MQLQEITEQDLSPTTKNSTDNPMTSTHSHSHPHGTITSNSASLYDKLFDGNRKWVQEKLAEDPQFFEKLVKGQQPKYLLIGCSDSRVPPDQLTQTNPGEIFIHRNVANMVVSSDMNLMAVMQYAVAVLQVEHIIVMGHYNCGGVKASMERSSLGLIDKWICNIKDVYRLHQEELDSVKDEEQRFRKLVELNVKEQVLNVCKTSVVQKRWKDGMELHVHGWVYELGTGLITDLKVDVFDEWAKLNSMYSFEFKSEPAPESLQRKKSHKQLLATLNQQSAEKAAQKALASENENQALRTVGIFAVFALGVFLAKSLIK